jgi:anti-sigma B factor antagonist
MSRENMQIDDQPGSRAGCRVLRLTGPLVLTTIFGFQSLVRADTCQSLIIDFANVPYVDSAGIGALVGAYVSRQHAGRSLALVAVCQRIRHALEVAHVEQFFRFFDSVAEAEGVAA